MIILGRRQKEEWREKQQNHEMIEGARGLPNLTHYCISIAENLHFPYSLPLFCCYFILKLCFKWKISHFAPLRKINLSPFYPNGNNKDYDN